MLDIDSLRYKVERSETLRPAFREAYFLKSPWHSNEVLDDLISVLTPRELEENKWAILRTYEWLAENKDSKEIAGLQGFEKQKILIGKFQQFSEEKIDKK
ncbi:MAG: hypothetical protein NC307_12550 [Roseburia sp.]|nr:hypothetical protein [Roseburia sp.]